MGRKCMEEGKRRSTHLHIRMTSQERDTLKRFANYINRTDTDIVMYALSWYYGSVLTEDEYERIIEKGENRR